ANKNPFRPLRHLRSIPVSLPIAGNGAFQTTVDQTLIRGLDTAGPCLRLGLPLSVSGRRRMSATQFSRGFPSVAPSPAMRRDRRRVLFGIGLRVTVLAAFSGQPAKRGATCWPIAHRKAAISRATAVVTRHGFLPAAVSRR